MCLVRFVFNTPPTSEVGPGGRVGINLLLHCPPALMRDCSQDLSAQYFSDKASTLRQKCMRSPLLRPHEGDCAEIAKAKALIRQQCETVEGFQFLACEHSKIVRWLMTGNITYERGYWEWYAACDPQ